MQKTVTALTCACPSSVVLKFDCSNAFNTMPRQLVLDAVRARVRSLAHAASFWLSQPTTHLFWEGGGRGKPITATTGVDQGSPLSPAFFAIGLADFLERIQRQLVTLSPACRVFSYLDDVVVVAPAGVSGQAMQAVIAELQAVGLTVNAGKTAAWTADPQVPLPPEVQGLRVDKCRLLGACAPWLENDGDLARSECSVWPKGRKWCAPPATSSPEWSRLGV